MEALKRSDEKWIVTQEKPMKNGKLLKKDRRENRKLLKKRPMKEWITSQGKLMRCWKSLCWLLTQLGARFKG